MNSIAWLHGKPEVSGILKQSPADFVVKEDLGFEPDGEGEHVLVYLRKTGCNTQFVADALARFARIPARSVSYAGLKDRQAVTEQWFCLHIPGKDTPDFRLFTLEGCEVLATQRHRRKLRIGYLKGNAFELVLREVSQQSALEQRLALIAARGVPNYFGEQRFGRGGNNLQQAERWAKNEIQVKERSKRSFYLSAARSALFNTVVSARIQSGLVTKVLPGDAMQLAGRGSWFVTQPDEVENVQLRLDQQELFITAPLPGDGDLGTQGDALEFESQQLASQSLLSGLLKRERLECARRAALVIPQNVSWQWLDEETLSLHFYLPAGSYATSLVRELMLITNDRHLDITE